MNQRQKKEKKNKHRRQCLTVLRAVRLVVQTLHVSANDQLQAWTLSFANRSATGLLWRSASDVSEAAVSVHKLSRPVYSYVKKKLSDRDLHVCDICRTLLQSKRVSSIRCLVHFFEYTIKAKVTFLLAQPGRVFKNEYEANSGQNFLLDCHPFCFLLHKILFYYIVYIFS